MSNLRKHDILTPCLHNDLDSTLKIVIKICGWDMTMIWWFMFLRNADHYGLSKIYMSMV